MKKKPTSPTKTKKPNLASWEKEVKEGHPEREFKGLLDKLLHEEMTFSILTSPEIKKVFTDETGELEYLESVRKQETAVKLRKAEMKVLKKILTVNT